jgi:vacuolar protein sorting-associated protein 13A/C
VTELLRRHLGAWVEGLDSQKLKISVWKGDVVLKNLKLKPEALKGLNLPVRVHAGMLGTLRLKVPWHNLGKEPVMVEVNPRFQTPNLEP